MRKSILILVILSSISCEAFAQPAVAPLSIQADLTGAGGSDAPLSPLIFALSCRLSLDVSNASRACSMRITGNVALGSLEENRVLISFTKENTGTRADEIAFVMVGSNLASHEKSISVDLLLDGLSVFTALIPEGQNGSLRVTDQRLNEIFEKIKRGSEGEVRLGSGSNLQRIPFFINRRKTECVARVLLFAHTDARRIAPNGRIYTCNFYEHLSAVRISADNATMLLANRELSFAEEQRRIAVQRATRPMSQREFDAIFRDSFGSANPRATR